MMRRRKTLSLLSLYSSLIAHVKSTSLICLTIKALPPALGHLEPIIEYDNIQHPGDLHGFYSESIESIIGRASS